MNNYISLLSSVVAQ